MQHTCAPLLVGGEDAAINTPLITVLQCIQEPLRKDADCTIRLEKREFEWRSREGGKGGSVLIEKLVRRKTRYSTSGLKESSGPR